MIDYTLPGEEWKEVRDSDGKYHVSTFGRVLISNYKNTGENRLCNIKSDADGYCRVNIRTKLVSRPFLVHRLVATHFLDLPEDAEKNQVNHIDGNKFNNHVRNLEWVSPYENTFHARKMGLSDNSGVKNGAARLEECDVKVIRKLAASGRISQVKLSQIFNVSPMTISLIVNHKTWENV